MDACAYTPSVHNFEIMCLSGTYSSHMELNAINNDLEIEKNNKDNTLMRKEGT